MRFVIGWLFHAAMLLKALRMSTVQVQFNDAVVERELILITRLMM